MATWTAGTALASGALITQAWVQNVVNAQKFLAANDATYGKDLAQLRRNTDQSITASTYTAVSFNTEDVDVADGHGTANPTRYTARAGGKYLISASANLAYTAGAPLLIGVIRKNGTGSSITGAIDASWSQMNPGTSTRQTVTIPGFVTSLQGTSTNGTATTPDYIEFVLWHNGTSLSVDSTYGGAQMCVQWIGAT